MRTAVRALLLAALFVVVPATAAYAGVTPDDTLPYVTTTKPTTTTAPERRPAASIVPARAQGGQALAVTGSDSTPLVWAGVAAVSIGAVLVIGARRRASVRR